MADDVTLNSMTGGDVIGADDISSVKYQRVKIIIGANGTNDGDVASGNPLPVTANAGTNLNTSALALETGGNLAASATSLALLDDAIAILGTATYTEAATKAVVIAAIRRDADTTLVDTTNEVAPLQVNAVGQLKVEIFDGGDSHTVDNNGTFITQIDGAALTALQLIDDIVYVDDTATHATGTSKGTLIMAAAVPTDAAVDANDIAAVAMTLDRKLHVAVMDALPAGTAAIGKLAANSGVDIGDVDITSIAAGDNNIGNVDIASIAAGDNNIGNVDVLTIAAGTNGIGNVGIIPRTTGGLTTYHLVSAATTNATVVKNAAGQLFGYFVYNNATTMRKVAFHDTASAPTAGASIFFTINIPGSSAANVLNPMGIAFATGIAITTVTDVADNGTTAVALNDLTINLWYT